MEQTPKIPYALTNISCTFTKPSPNLPFIFEPTHKCSNIPNSPHAPEASSKHSLTIAPASPSHTMPPKLPKEHGCMYVCLCLRMYACMVYLCMSQEVYVCTWAPGGLCTHFKCAAAAASSDQATHDQIAVFSEESCNLKLKERQAPGTGICTWGLMLGIGILTWNLGPEIRSEMLESGT